MKRFISFLVVICMLLLITSCFFGEHEHTPEKIAARSATCIEGGNTEYYRCTECGKLFSDSACQTETIKEAHTLDPLGHEWNDASCTAPKSCSRCNVTEGDALGHEWSGDCDTTCNRDACSETRVAQSHLDANEDDVCDTCGADTSSDISIGGGDGEFLPPDDFED